MKVLSVIESLELGGAETVAVSVCLGLTDHDQRFVHFSSANGLAVHAPFVAALINAGVQVDDADYRTWLPRAAGGGSHDGWRPDVVLFHWWRNHPLAGWIEAARGERCPPAFVCVAHHRGSLAGPPYDAYVLVSPSQRDEIGDIDRHRVRVIPNGVEAQRFAMLSPRTPGQPFTIGRLSSLREGKIPRDWVATAAAFDLPGARWVICGEGDVLPALRGDAARLGVENRFDFPGAIAPELVPDVLASFDVVCYVTSSAVECHPLALIEAALAGRPIVAQPRGGVGDVVRHGMSGLLGTSATEIEAHLRALRDDAGLRGRLAHGARQVGLEFSLERMRSSYRELVAELGRQRMADAA